MNKIFFKLFNQENEFLHELFKFATPEREDVSGYGCDLYELDSKEVCFSLKICSTHLCEQTVF